MASNESSIQVAESGSKGSVVVTRIFRSGGECRMSRTFLSFFIIIGYIRRFGLVMGNKFFVRLVSFRRRK